MGSGTSSGSLAEDSPYDLMFDPSGALIVGTGRNGKLYSLSGEPTTATLLMQASAQQVTGFARDAKGNVYLRHLESRKDLQAVAAARRRRHLHVARARRADRRRLGHAELARVACRQAAASTCLRDRATRPRQTIRGAPGAGPYAAANGEEIKSPNARYLQWKAVLAGKQASPVLTSVSAAYVQRNLRPKVTSLTVHPAGTVFQKPYPTGDPDIAGFDDQAPDRRILSATAKSRQQQLGRSDGARISAVCRRSCGVPKTPTTTSCGTRFCIAAKARRPGSR